MPSGRRPASNGLIWAKQTLFVHAALSFCRITTGQMGGTKVSRKDYIHCTGPSKAVDVCSSPTQPQEIFHKKLPEDVFEVWQEAGGKDVPPFGHGRIHIHASHPASPFYQWSKMSFPLTPNSSPGASKNVLRTLCYHCHT